jgi:hypothetical protein
MKTDKSSPIHVSLFVLCWILASLLLYPLVIGPVMFAYRLVVNHLLPAEALVQTFNRFGAPWYYEFDLLAAMFIAFTAATALVQHAMFVRVLRVHVRYWWLATLIGGWVGTFLMIRLELDAPFYMLPWFAALSLAQWWTIRRMTRYAFLWVVAHCALSLLFPIWGEGLALIARWCVAMLIYAVAILLVIERLAQNARWDKAKQHA